MKKKVLMLVFILTTSFVFCFTGQNQITNYLRNGNYVEAKILLNEWEREDPDNPDLQTGLFNYYLHRNARDESFVGYMQNGQYGMYTKTIYDEKDLQEAISYLDKALKNYPYRMGIHFGKINSLLKAEHYKEATEAIENLLIIYKKNKTDWYWTNNVKFTDNKWNVEETIIDACNDYCSMYDYVIDREFSKKAVETILQSFPDNVIFLNYLAAYYSYGKDYQKSLEILMRAYEKDENDFIIVANIARNYEYIENYTEALKWYEKLSNMDSEEEKSYAQEGINRIKNK